MLFVFSKKFQASKISDFSIKNYYNSFRKVYTSHGWPQNIYKFGEQGLKY